MLRLLTLCLVASFALSGPVQAQSQTTPRPNNPVGAPSPQAKPAPREPALGVGTTELTIGGSFTGAKSSGAASTFTVFELSTHVGFVVTKHLEALVGTSVAKAGGLDPMGSLTGGVLYNFVDRGRVIPFAGATVGKAFGASASTASGPVILDINGGFRVMTRGGGGALIIRPFYQRQLNSDDLSGGSGFRRFGVAFGTSIFF